MNEIDLVAYKKAKANEWTSNRNKRIWKENPYDPKANPEPKADNDLQCTLCKTIVDGEGWYNRKRCPVCGAGKKAFVRMPWRNGPFEWRPEEKERIEKQLKRRICHTGTPDKKNCQLTTPDERKRIIPHDGISFTISNLYDYIIYGINYFPNLTHEEVVTLCKMRNAQKTRMRKKAEKEKKE